MRNTILMLGVLFFGGCSTTQTSTTPTAPKGEIRADFSQKKEQLKKALNSFQNEKAVQILESMNELEQKEALAWLPADRSSSLQTMRLYYILGEHNKNAPKIYRVKIEDSAETKKAFDLVMKALKFDKSAINGLYKNNDMDFFQSTIEKMKKEIKRGHKYNEDEIFKMLQSDNGRVKKYGIDVRNYFPEESTLYKNEVPSTVNSIEERNIKWEKELKQKKAYQLKIARMTPIKFYNIKKFKNHTVFHSFKTIISDKHIKSIDVDLEFNQQVQHQIE